MSLWGHQYYPAGKNDFIAAFRNLINEERIHKKDLKKLNKIASKLNNAGNSRELMNRMADYGRDVEYLTKGFNHFIKKLQMQNSGMLIKKSEYLVKIYSKMLPVVEQINKQKNLNLVNDEILKLETAIAQKRKENNEYKNLILLINKDISDLKEQNEKISYELATTSADEFAKIDTRKRANAEAMIAKLEAVWSAKRDELTQAIGKFEKAKDNLYTFALNNSCSPSRVKNDLNKALAGELYEKSSAWNDTWWIDHIKSDEYVMKKFDYTLQEGRRTYSQLIKTPGPKAREWQKLISFYRKSPKEILKYKSALTELNHDYTTRVSLIRKAANEPKQKLLSRLLNEKKENIQKLINKKRGFLQAIVNCELSTPSLEKQKSILFDYKTQLEGQLNVCAKSGKKLS